LRCGIAQVKIRDMVKHRFKFEIWYSTGLNLRYGIAQV